MQYAAIELVAFTLCDAQSSRCDALCSRCTGYDVMHGMQYAARCAGWLRCNALSCTGCDARDAMRCTVRGLVAVAGAGGAMLLTMVFFMRVFLIQVKHPYVQLSSPDRQKG